LAALEDDPLRAAECLARPLLVGRLAHAYFEADERFNNGDARPSFAEWLAGLDPELGYSPMGAPEDWTGWQLPELGGGAGDSWTPTAAMPESTIGITAVWTGTEMIVWGGGRNTGSRYDPLTDTDLDGDDRRALAPPRPRGGVTGTQMVVWGGCGQSTEFCEVGRRSATTRWTTHGRRRQRAQSRRDASTPPFGPAPR
jgi:hypothetical protein